MMSLRKVSWWNGERFGDVIVYCNANNLEMVLSVRLEEWGFLDATSTTTDNGSGSSPSLDVAQVNTTLEKNVTGRSPTRTPGVTNNLKLETEKLTPKISLECELFISDIPSSRCRLTSRIQRLQHRDSPWYFFRSWVRCKRQTFKLRIRVGCFSSIATNN